MPRAGLNTACGRQTLKQHHHKSSIVTMSVYARVPPLTAAYSLVQTGLLPFERVSRLHKLWRSKANHDVRW